jgi:hypothetical protein
MITTSVLIFLVVMIVCMKCTQEILNVKLLVAPHGRIYTCVGFISRVFFMERYYPAGRRKAQVITIMWSIYMPSFRNKLTHITC